MINGAPALFGLYPLPAITTTIPEPDRRCPKCLEMMRLDTQSHSDAVRLGHDEARWYCPSLLPGHEKWQPFRLREVVSAALKVMKYQVHGPEVRCACGCGQSLEGMHRRRRYYAREHRANDPLYKAWACPYCRRLKRHCHLHGGPDKKALARHRTKKRYYTQRGRPVPA